MAHLSGGPRRHVELAQPDDELKLVRIDDEVGSPAIISLSDNSIVRVLPVDEDWWVSDVNKRGITGAQRPASVAGLADSALSLFAGTDDQLGLSDLRFEMLDL